MSMNGKRLSLVILVIFFAIFFLSQFFAIGAVLAQEDFFDMFNLDEREEGFFEMVDERDGSTILRTARIMHVGDEFIDAKNRLFRVVEIRGNLAIARFIRNVKLALPPGRDAEAFSYMGNGVPAAQNQDTGLVALYHSHGAEAYLPSEGDDSIEEGGGILKVGKTLASVLREKGVDVEHSLETHTPHDAGAYVRSRRTAEELMKNNPDALIDLHRDGVPAEEYLETIEGEERVQVLFVVGRQNQNAANNREFAEGLKSVADDKKPGLVKGILMAQGNYNQDLSPRALLVEAGTYQNEKEMAKESVTSFASVLNTYLYGTGEGEELAEPSPDVAGRIGGTAIRRAMWIILFFVAGTFIYLFVSAGSWDEFKRKLQSYFHREFRK